MRARGLLITLEGNEGCGKSTQIRLLYRHLRSLGISAEITREPGGTLIGDAIRRVLLDARHRRMSGACETLLYMASRAQLVEQVIRPKLLDRKIVLCDRWMDATVAYQGFGSGIDAEWIRRIGRFATGGLRPDRTIFLDLPLEAGLRRAAKRHPADRIERKALAYHRRVRRGYLSILRREPRRFIRVAVREDETIWEVHQKIKDALRDVLRAI